MIASIGLVAYQASGEEAVEGVAVRPAAQAACLVQELVAVCGEMVCEGLEAEVLMAGEEGGHLAVGLLGGDGADCINQSAPRFDQRGRLSYNFV